MNTKSPLPRLVLCAIWIALACPRGHTQVIRVEAPINMAESATAPPVMRSVPGVMVLATESIVDPMAFPAGAPPSQHATSCNVSTPYSGMFVRFIAHDRCTDEWGDVSFPFIGTPVLASVIGPSAPDIRVRTTGSYLGYILTPAQYRSDFTLGPVPSNLDLTAGLGAGSPGTLSSAEINAFFHLHAAKRTLDPYGTPASSRDVSIVLHQFSHPFGAASPSEKQALYKPNLEAIFLHAPLTTGYTGPSSLVAAFSGTTIAHEYAHRIVMDVYGTCFLPARLAEGLCDYMAFLVTGHARIAVGVLPTPRDLAALPAPMLGAWTASYHRDGLVLGSAIYRARMAMGAIGRGHAFDLAFRTALHTCPPDEVAFLTRLHAATAGNPGDQAIILNAFAQGGIVLSATNPARQATALAGGWGHGVHSPQLTGWVDPQGGGATIEFTDWVPGSTVSLFLSQPSTAMLPTPYGNLFVDPITLGAPIDLVVDAQGALTIPLPATLSIAPTALQAVAPLSGAPLGLMTSNGLLLAL